MRAPIHYVAGLERLAEGDGVSIPEASLTAIKEAIAFTANRNKTKHLPEVVEDIVAATEELNPGIIYTQGLKGISNVDEVLRNATQTAVAQAEEVRADEHIAPITAAFRFLTGQNFSRTP